MPGAGDTVRHMGAVSPATPGRRSVRGVSIGFVSDHVSQAGVPEGTDEPSRRRVWIAVAGIGVMAAAVVALVVVGGSEDSTGYTCTTQGGRVFNVATPDVAFEEWWQTNGPAAAVQLTQAVPAISVETPVMEDFVREDGSDGSAGWTWEFADGEMVSVSVSRVTTADGWMVAANRCSA